MLKSKVWLQDPIHDYHCQELAGNEEEIWNDNHKQQLQETSVTCQTCMNLTILNVKLITIVFFIIMLQYCSQGHIAAFLG